MSEIKTIITNINLEKWAFYLSPVMMDEENVKNCILCCQPCNELGKAMKVVDWEHLKVMASKWKGLDKYSNAYHNFDWEEGSAGLVWHKLCKKDMCRKEKLQQALKRKRKMMQTK